MKLVKKLVATVLFCTVFFVVAVLGAEHVEDLYNNETGVNVLYNDFLGTIEKATFKTNVIKNGKKEVENYVYPLKVVRYQEDNKYISFKNNNYDSLNFYLASFYHYYDYTNDIFTYSVAQHLDHLREFPIKKGKTRGIKSIYSEAFQKEANVSFKDLKNTPFIIDYYLIHSQSVIKDTTELTGVDDVFYDGQLNNIEYKRIPKTYATEKTGFISVLVVPDDFEPSIENFEALGIVVSQYTPNPDVQNIADVNIAIDGEAKELTLPALNIDDRIFYPVRECLELINADIQWIEETKTAICSINDNTVEFTVDSDIYKINGEGFVIDDGVKVFLDDGNMYIPIRIAFEALGFDAIWNEDTNTVNIVEQ